MKTKIFPLWIATTIFIQILCTVAVTAAQNVVTTISLTADASYSNVVSGFGEDLYIEGKTPDITLSLPASVSLNSNIKIDNLVLSGECTFYANGYTLEIGENVTSTHRLTVYGGRNGVKVAKTNIILCGGQYKSIYGGGSGGGVTGNTNVYVGGNANFADETDDEKAGYYGSYIYGGSNNAAVEGTTNVTLDGNAAAAYIFGAGSGAAGTAANTNVYIKGGRAANVYGGAPSAILSDCNLNILMTGGRIESIFGGNGAGTITGTVNVTLLGGDVTRRVYTGCYNEWKILWKTKDYVNGTTTLKIGPDVLLNTKNGLSSGNSDNVGVFAGSRLGGNGNSNEKNTLIYLDGCYSTQSSKIGDKSGWSLVFYSNAKYTVNASAGGNVSSTGTAGAVLVEPDFGKYAEIGGEKCGKKTVNILTGTTTVDFKDDFNIYTLATEKTHTGVTASVDFAAVNVAEEVNPCLYTALFDSENTLIAVDKTTLPGDTTTKTVNFECTLDEGKEYHTKAMIFNGEAKPLCNALTSSVN